MRRIVGSAVLTVFIAFSAIWLAQNIRATSGVPLHLDILSATIEDLPPIESSDVPSRQVALRIKLAAAPLCNAATGALTYGFLIDSDKNPATGDASAAFSDLGVDAQASMRCDPGSAAFTSPLGTVVVTTEQATGVTTLELLTTVAQLPSTDFRWIAFAQETASFSRLPKEPDHGAWAILERRLH